MLPRVVWPGLVRVVVSACAIVLCAALPAGAGELKRIPTNPGIQPRYALPQPARFRLSDATAAQVAASNEKVRTGVAAAGLKSLGVTARRGRVPGAMYGDATTGRLAGHSALQQADSFLQAFGPVYGLSAADLGSVSKEERLGLDADHREVVLRQHVAGRRLYGGTIHLHVGLSGEFVAAVGQMYGNLRWQAAQALTADAARQRASDFVDKVVPPPAAGPVRRADTVRSVTEEVAYPLGDVAHPAFAISGVSAANGIDRFDVVVDGATGEVLEVAPRTFYAQGQIFRNASAVPQSPQPSATVGVVPPTPNPPVYVSRVTFAFPTAWLATAATTLSGNNADARQYQGWVGGVTDNTVGTVITKPDSDFSFPLTIGSLPPPDVRSYPEAAATNLFYLVNYAHDYFYGLGFNEARGNFQVDNFGLGGLGGDAVLAFAQLGSGAAAGDYAYASDNAWMSTGADGDYPVMGMYVFHATGTPPNVIYVADDSYDPEVVLHEYTHGVTHRLAAGYLPGPGQSGAFNEGNSDFFALNMLVPSGAPAAGAYPVGGYSVQNFTAGIRNYPYSTDLTTDPLKYADLGHINWWGPEVHDDGEIWTATLWELRASLVATYGYAPGRTRAAQLVIDALQLLPDAPTYTDFRDALLAADQARYAGADKPAMWTAFSKRGLGGTADGSYDGYCTHVLADTSAPSTGARIRLWESSYFPGEVVRVMVSDSNAASSTATLRTTSGDLETLPLTAGGNAFSGSLSSALGLPIRGDGILQLTPGDTITATTTDANNGGVTPVLSTTAAVHGAYAVSMVPSLFNVADSPTWAFSGDDVEQAYSLLFTFPFYGRSYDIIMVNTNGSVSFGGFAGGRERGVGRNGAPASIEPFALDLNCNSDGVYVNGDAVSATFRWSCTEYGTANPANVALTLFPSGSFRFDYGSGNILTGTDWWTGSPNRATVGLVRGTDTMAQVVSGYDGSTNLGNAQSVVFTPAGDQQIVPTCVTTFNDPTLTPGSTPIRGVHITQLRDCANALRLQAGLWKLGFTDPDPGGVFVRALHILELRNAIDPARLALQLPAIPYARPNLSAGQGILAQDINELRSGVH